jgi:hypothetical protein
VPTFARLSAAAFSKSGKDALEKITVDAAALFGKGVYQREVAELVHQPGHATRPGMDEGDGLGVEQLRRAARDAKAVRDVGTRILEAHRTEVKID